MKTEINKTVKSSALDYYGVLLEVIKSSSQYDSEHGIKSDSKKESVNKTCNAELVVNKMSIYDPMMIYLL
jgi:hypothetical protein